MPLDVDLKTKRDNLKAAYELYLLFTDTSKSLFDKHDEVEKDKLGIDQKLTDEVAELMGKFVYHAENTIQAMSACIEEYCALLNEMEEYYLKGITTKEAAKNVH